MFVSTTMMMSDRLTENPEPSEYRASARNRITPIQPPALTSHLTMAGQASGSRVSTGNSRKNPSNPASQSSVPGSLLSE